MNSPRYEPAGLLLSWRGQRLMFDGGHGAVPTRPVDAWLVCDARSELMPAIRRHGSHIGADPVVTTWHGDDLHAGPLPVVHTSHDTYGYLVTAAGITIVWAPEFYHFPDWSAGADLMFADAAGWRRPIRFAGGVGGHACVSETADRARRLRVRRLIFAHIGRPSIRARDAGLTPPYGEWGEQGSVYRVAAAGSP